jgi:CRISPR/Cas system CSM-associated protein Csm5 (group 7 of RAMP superfamily)
MPYGVDQRDIHVEVISPVHVGIGRESDYIKGLDFLYRNGEYYFLNQEKLIASLDKHELAIVSSYLAQGKFREFSDIVAKRLNNQTVTHKCYSEFQATESIKRTYADALGKWVIPGSSLKGVFRSILLTYLYKTLRLPEERYSERSLLGSIDANLMRFIQVADCMMQPDTYPQVFPTKIFSADQIRGSKVGQWKHARQGGHDDRFSAQGFVSYYEMLPIDAEGSFRMKWGASQYLVSQQGNRMPNIEHVFRDKDLNWFFEEARIQMNNFLEKELAFFEAYPNEDIESSNLLDDIRWMLEENQKKESCLIRVGANVGFHSITGDWRYSNDHTRTGFDTKSGAIKYKTRKLVFMQDDLGFAYYLPGFVRLKL